MKKVYEAPVAEKIRFTMQDVLAASDFIIENAQPGDIIFTMGAGDINQICKPLLN